MTPSVIGTILILFGTIHVIKPDIFRRLMSRKIVFNPQRYSEKGFRIAIRFLGIFLILIGALLLLVKP